MTLPFRRWRAALCRRPVLLLVARADGGGGGSDCGAGEQPSYVGAPTTGAGTGCRWSPSEVEVRHDDDGDEGGGHEVDGGAERGPPAGVGHESGAVLPEVLE